MYLFITREGDKETVWCKTNIIETFFEFIQYVLDGCNNAESFMVVKEKNGETMNLVDVAALYGMRRRTFEERCNNAYVGTWKENFGIN